MTSGEPIVRDNRTREMRTVFGGDRCQWVATAEGMNRARRVFGRRAIGVVAAVALAACGAGGGSAVTSLGAATPAAATPTVSSVAAPPAASPPLGGPAPAELIGTWYQIASGTAALTLTATVYVLRDSGEQGSGDIVVNGSEIDFFSGTLCPLVLPQGVGRYQWTLHRTTMHLVPLNKDPCGRVDLLTNQSYTKGGS